MEANAAFQVLSLNDVDQTVRDYKKRKLHKKTKSGCLTCKAKKVKCDESRPVCQRCIRNCRNCTYGQPYRYEQESIQSNLTADLMETGSLSALSTVTIIPFSVPSSKHGTSSLSLMQHFQSYWTEIFYIPHSNEVISLSKSNPLVTSTILTITACHLRHISPGMVQHRIAEHFQQSAALKDLQTALNTPRKELGLAGVNALLFSAALLNLVAFALPSDADSDDADLNPCSSWVFSPREDRLGWLALQAGLRPLLLSVAPYLEQSRGFLEQIFFGDSGEGWATGKVGCGLEGVPELWIRFFDLENGSSNCDCEKLSPGEVFRAPVLILMVLRELEPVPVNAYKNLQFLGKIQQEFRTFLYDRDERALWLFGYWLGLMHRYNGLWWCDKRARRDYKAIRMWLEELHLTRRPGTEGEMWREMMKEFDLAPVLPT